LPEPSPTVIVGGALTVTVTQSCVEPEPPPSVPFAVAQIWCDPGVSVGRLAVHVTDAGPFAGNAGDTVVAVAGPPSTETVTDLSCEATTPGTVSTASDASASGWQVVPKYAEICASEPLRLDAADPHDPEAPTANVWTVMLIGDECGPGSVPSTVPMGWLWIVCVGRPSDRYATTTLDVVTCVSRSFSS
jgi:hypothetical protein